MGFTDEAIAEELKQNTDDDVCEIWPEHLDVLNLFIGVQNCWKQPLMGGKPYGLDKTQVESELRVMFPKKQHRDLWQQLKVIEAAALEAWPSK